MVLEDFDRGKLIENDYGQFLLFGKKSSEIDAMPVRKYIRKNREFIFRKNIREIMGKRLPALSKVYKKDMVFFDIENCGFKYADPIFMISLGYFNGSVNTEVLFARDFFEEKAMLKYFVDTLTEVKERNHNAFLSFNGNSFDVPRLSERIKHNGMGLEGYRTFKEWINDDHIDLYRVLKKNWYNMVFPFGNLPDCGLQTVKKIVFDYHRSGDIPSKKIPDAYYEYVYGRKINGEEVDEAESIENIKKIIDHNVKDTLSLVGTLAYLCCYENS